MNVSLHIERLVLDGLALSESQAPELRAAFETALADLLRERGIAGLSGGAVPQIAAAPIRLAPGGPPARWGRQIAHSLFAGLAPEMPTAARRPRDSRVRPAARESAAVPSRQRIQTE